MCRKFTYSTVTYLIFSPAGQHSECWGTIEPKIDFALEELHFSSTKWEVLKIPDVEDDHKSISDSESGVEESCSQLEDGGGAREEGQFFTETREAKCCTLECCRRKLLRVLHGDEAAGQRVSKLEKEERGLLWQLVQKYMYNIKTAWI